jgi:hypothetical protein
VNSVSALDDSDDDCWLNAIDAVSEKSMSVVEANVDRIVTAPMNVNDCEVRFQLDSAADVNTICKKFVRKDQVRPTSMKPLGEAKSYREESEYVTEPTEWVSQMAVVRKSNSKLRICIDPQPLNTALMCEHYRLTTLEDVLSKLANARIFSKLDIREAYWHVKLSENSSRLTDDNTIRTISLSAITVRIEGIERNISKKIDRSSW